MTHAEMYDGRSFCDPRGASSLPPVHDDYIPQNQWHEDPAALARVTCHLCLQRVRLLALVAAVSSPSRDQVDQAIHDMEVMRERFAADVLRRLAQSRDDLARQLTSHVDATTAAIAGFVASHAAALADAELCHDVHAFVDGELTDDRASAVRAHLTRCARCHAVALDVATLRARLAP